MVGNSVLPSYKDEHLNCRQGQLHCYAFTCSPSSERRERFKRPVKHGALVLNCMERWETVRLCQE